MISRALPGLLLATLMSPWPALAQDGPYDDGEKLAPAPKRKHARPIEGEPAPAPVQATPGRSPVRAAEGGGVAPASQGRGSDDGAGWADDDDAPTRREGLDSERSSRRGGGDDEVEEPPRGRRRSHDDDEDRPRRSRTAEEELGGHDVWDDERLSELDEPGQGFGVQALVGAMLLDDPLGGVKEHLLGGVVVDWEVGRKLFPPEEEWLHSGLLVEVSYLYTGKDYGTEMVRVDSDYHYLSLAGLVGYPVLPKLLAYGKLGPLLAIMPTTYAIKNTASTTDLTDFTGVKGGVVYGLGARACLYLTDKVGVMGRVEVTRFRRGYMNDTLLGASVGVAF